MTAEQQHLASSARTLASRLGAAAFVLALVAACSGGSSSNGAKVCKPGSSVYCRCQDRQEGTKLCNDDGTGYDACLPCETYDDPEVPPDPPLDFDAGADALASNPADCGDRAVQQGEDCDDGNTDDSDGCDASCRLSGSDPPASRSCPGLDVHVWGTHAVELSASTLGSPNTTSATPACPSAAGNTPATGSAASDRLFHVTAHASGLLTVTTSDTGFDNFVYVLDACAAGANAYVTCANEIAGAGGETIAFPVDAGESYTVVVDGTGTNGPKEGSFRVTFTLE
jgi:cysteine-rich repeat protein